MLYLFGYGKNCITEIYHNEKSALSKVKKEKCSGALRACLYTVPEDALIKYNTDLIGDIEVKLYTSLYRKGATLFPINFARTELRNITNTKSKIYIDLESHCPSYNSIDSTMYSNQVISMLIEKLLVLKARKAIKENNINKTVGIRLNNKVVISDVMKFNGGK
jgi:hypothetical protein